jgi:hypothetical protein
MDSGEPIASDDRHSVPYLHFLSLRPAEFVLVRNDSVPYGSWFFYRERLLVSNRVPLSCRWAYLPCDQ